MSEVPASESVIARPWRLVGVTLLLAALIFVGAVLPVEFGRDPLSLGRLTGLSRLHGGPETVPFSGPPGSVVARTYAGPFREDTIDIPLGYPGGGLGPYSVEYKLAMRAGDVVLYEWSTAAPDGGGGVEFDLHGHTLAAAEGGQVTVAEYRKGTATSERGALVAPLDGIHGWYFANRSSGPVTVRLRVRGAYQLIEPGREGNEAGLTPIAHEQLDHQSR